MAYGNIGHGAGGANAGADETQVNLVLKNFGSGGGTAGTRRALLSKSGNVVTMILEPVGLSDDSAPLTTTTNSTFGTDNQPIPAEYRPANHTTRPIVVYEAAGGGSFVVANLIIYNSGDVEIGKASGANGTFTDSTTVSGWAAHSIIWSTEAFA